MIILLPYFYHEYSTEKEINVVDVIFKKRKKNILYFFLKYFQAFEKYLLIYIYI